jgi:hypothetical protein
MPGARCTRGLVSNKKHAQVLRNYFALPGDRSRPRETISSKVELSRPTTGKSLVATDARRSPRRSRRGMLAQPVRICSQREP